jgi:hypothetical protein
MNAYTIRQYWLSKYEDKFQEEYVSEKAKIEPFLLKRLLNNYNQYLVLEAIDRFFSNTKKERASILLFASKKFFEGYFKDLIKEKDVIQYQRMLPWYSLENQVKIRDLIQAYRNYIFAISLSQEEIDEMGVILERLRNIPLDNIAEEPNE